MSDEVGPVEAATAAPGERRDAPPWRVWELVGRDGELIERFDNHNDAATAALRHSDVYVRVVRR